MRPVLFCLMFCSTVLWPAQGSRLGRLEDDVKLLKTFIFGELSSIRGEVKEISNRVDILENLTVTYDPSSPYQDMDITSYNFNDHTGEIGKQLLRDGSHEASPVISAEVQYMRKAYTKDKQNLHQLKQDVKDKLREFEQKITSHMHNLTADVQHNIEYIHENISLANVTLLEFINWSSRNISTFSQNIKMEINVLSANTREKLALSVNKTETELKQSISSSYHKNKDNLEIFMALADRNVSEMMLKADNIFSLIRTNFSEMPIQISNLSLDLQTVSLNIQHVEEKQKHLFLLTCNKDFINNNGNIQDGYYYPCVRDVRLANASLYGSNGVQGLLEVRHAYAWGTVCDDFFQSGNVNESLITNNVNVVCRTFGFRECAYVSDAVLGKGSGDILMDDIKCGGAESSFLECPNRGWGVHNCGHHEDVGFRMWN